MMGNRALVALLILCCGRESGLLYFNCAVE